MKKLIIFIMVLTTILMGCGVSQPIQPIPPAPPITYETIWSGKVSIKIETPSTEEGKVIDINDLRGGKVKVTEISTMSLPSEWIGGEWDEDTKTWQVSILRGDHAMLGIVLKNTGGDFATVYTYISNTTPAPGVKLSAVPLANGWDELVIPSGETRWVTFNVRSGTEVALGTSLDDIELAIRSK